MVKARKQAVGMPDRSEIWVVIPAFNEARMIRATLRDVLIHFNNVVVVDDCSTDGTGRVAQQSGAHVCRHPTNLGQGAALQTGIDYALEKGARVIVTFDADGQHEVADSVAMVGLLDRERCDVVLASRFLGATLGMSAAKTLFLKLAVWYTRITTGLAVTDTHNGLRVFSRSAAETVRIRQNRMAHASEILEAIGTLNLRYLEMPTTMVYTDYSKAKGQSMTGAVDILVDLYVTRLYRW